MTEEQIERAVEWKVDVLDKRLMDGSLSQEEYDNEMKRIRAWADYQYDYHYGKVSR